VEVSCINGGLAAATGDMAMSDLVTLSPVYPPGGCLAGEAPEYYRVTAMDGAIVIDCSTLQEAQTYFARWALEVVA
jgi:hypothetical protein